MAAIAKTATINLKFMNAPLFSVFLKLIRLGRCRKAISALGHEHLHCDRPCPLYPQEQTLALHKSMSAWGQKRTLSATHDVADNQRQAGDNDRESDDDKKNQGPEPVGILKPLPRY